MSSATEICIKVNWDEMPRIEQKILEVLENAKVRNIGSADIYLQRRYDDFQLRIDLKPFEFPNTTNTKATQATLLPLTEELPMTNSITFRQEKESNQLVKRISVGIQTCAVLKKK